MKIKLHIAVLLASAFFSLPAQAQVNAEQAPSRNSLRDTLSLIVETNDLDHLRRNIEKLNAAVRKRHVTAGAVLLVGYDWKRASQSMPQDGPLRRGPLRIGSRQELAKMLSDARFAKSFSALLQKKHKSTNPQDPIIAALESLQLKDTSYRDAREVLDALRLSYSPTWIVRHRGKDYVFEGFDNPEGLFNAQGEFIRASY